MEQAPNGEELWRLALEHSPVGMALVGLDGHLFVVNRAFCEMLGYAEDDLVVRGFQELTHPDLASDLVAFQRALAGELDSYRLRKRYLHADGRIVWGDLSVALVRDPDGRPLHFISQILDVTEQRAAEHRLTTANAELEHERQTLEAIFETVNVGLLLIDREGRYERMNRRHQETMGLPFPDGHGGEAGQLGHVYFPDGHTLMGREDMPSYRAMQGEEFDELRYWVGDDPLTRAAFSTSARSVRGPDGELTGAALAYQDITDLMRAMQVKDEFVASVSHELRTPLTSVLGHLELLADRDDLPPDAAAQLEVVARNAHRLQGLVSDLLQVAQAREGGLQLHRAQVDLAVLVREAVQEARASAAAADVGLDVEAPAGLVGLVDAHRLRQVIDNLVSNAVKYTRPGGSVTVRLQQQEREIELVVSDTGIGIHEDELEQVFTRFFRGGGALQRHIPGTGLGLNIVHSIVTAHGGAVSLTSQVGHGSTFRVTLPQTSA
jgi:PAS domain S-box-containing protein